MKWFKNKIIVFLFALCLIFSVAVLTTNTFAKTKTATGCLYIGGPNYECPHSSLQNCYCEPIVVTP